ncbi:DNA-binding NarL/FixJ family response regulator [Flavobacterium sp. CG_9.1]|jgi:two-component system response regulator FimZ (fimbrial Z protein)|uniref:Response regulator transcription factor n=4 Tax=Flavobacterium TaxID=237 RepID=A0A4R5CX25_9FLAO|nr:MULTISPECIES: response regulator transcription factor [Flavobacterium]MBG6060608.1 DNA-binding NarL/FixJ family response regulator [Flavobacterium sp. CG_9.1]OAB27983.1 DNA-binding response regulator [Flavobacterium fryxellicola]TDE02465.1 response regulator transcription factor [Flavobacterium sandaracinum]SDI15563.1 two component transcriptional regulator, LuxR family [Flavobacterium omnivorum]SHL31637.1 two component transcriptional regulator, LuxR family [Flavobacterium xanthum]
MIKVCIADNFPVVHFGVKSYFKDNADISIVANVGNFLMVRDILQTKDIDVLVLDLELEGLSSIFEVKAVLKNFPKTKIIIFSGLSEQIYAPNAIKAGVSGFVHKSEKLETLGISIIKVYQGKIIMNETVKKNLALIAKQSKSERLYRKLSNREVEVLRYLSGGKKNHEIAEILGLNEKTISTYKLRLLTKLNVTNLVDLVEKAKKLEIV